MTPAEIASTLESHRLYLKGDPSGKRANLTGADLTGADLTGAYLARAYLRGADLTGADLTGAYLARAYLRGADLTDVKGVYGSLPAGALTVWKRLREGIAELLIPPDAKRLRPPTDSKCRAAYARVVSITAPDGSALARGTSLHDGAFVYLVGETVFPREPFNDDIREVCTSGIHFFTDRREAEEYR